MNLASRLKNKIDVYGRVPFVNELNQTDYKPDLLKSIWAEITVLNGNLKEGIANTVYADVGYKIVIRANSIQNLSNDMFFKFNNQRYDIKYFNPNYKYKDSIEIFCSLVVE